MAAQPKYFVEVRFGIGQYEGEWTGEEEKMETQVTTMCLSPSKKYAQLLYKSLTVERSKSGEQREKK